LVRQLPPGLDGARRLSETRAESFTHLAGCPGDTAIVRSRRRALEPAAASILACRGLTKFSKRLIHQLLLEGETMDHLGRLG
jgi:hypothetical protein